MHLLFYDDLPTEDGIQEPFVAKKILIIKKWQKK